MLLFILAIASASALHHPVGGEWLWKQSRRPGTEPSAKQLTWLYITHSGHREEINARLARSQLSSSAPKEKIKFCLYTRKNPDTFEDLTYLGLRSVRSSKFEPAHPTVIVIHGYMSSVSWDLTQQIKRELLSAGEYNVVGVDWSDLSMTLDYDTAVEGTRQVGRRLAIWLEWMKRWAGLRIDDLHLVGHSLGAHAAGFAAKQTNFTVTRITGLDPARPGFRGVRRSERLDAGDALFVDCIHTCAGDLGLEQPFCKADFYPNGGINPQPGCPWIDFLGYCSHARSYEYFAESVKRAHQFPAHKCTNVPTNSTAHCRPSQALMGFPASPRFKGVFYVVTNSASPFSTHIIKH